MLRLVLLISSSTMVNVHGLSLAHGNQHRAISSAKGLLFAQDQGQVPSGALFVSLVSSLHLLLSHRS